MSKPIVAIVGRPNVGKSTLFNQIGKKRVSIVDDFPGVTRDRIYLDAEWLNHQFTMIDTGGIELDSADQLLSSMRQQAQIAMEEADVIVFVVDGRAGLTSADEEVGKLLRSANKPVILAVNKTDSPQQEMNIYEFYNLGLGDPLGISASNALGLGDLLDAIVAAFPREAEEDKEADEISIAVIGRPNVGKSSILNQLLQEEKAIVTSIAGPTRDTVEGSIVIDGIQLNLIDTAGIRKTNDLVEKVGVEKSLKTIDKVDLVIIVLNNNEKLTKEDFDILEKTKNKKRIIVINKNDLDKKIDINKINEKNIIYTNTLSYEGIESLILKIKEMFNMEQLDVKDFNYVSNVDQLNRLYDAKKSLEDVEKGLKNDLPIDMIEIDLKNIWTILGEIIGETYTDELLDNLFRDFCVGK